MNLDKEISTPIAISLIVVCFVIAGTAVWQLAKPVEQPTPKQPSDYTTQSACKEVGYYWYKESCHKESQLKTIQKEDKDNNNLTLNKEEEKNNSIIDSENWETYKNQNYLTSFKYPDYWHICEPSGTSSKHINFFRITPSNDTYSCLYGSIDINVFIKDFSNLNQLKNYYKNLFTPEEKATIKETSFHGLSALKINYFAQIGMQREVIAFLHEANAYEIGYNPEIKEAHKKVFNQFLSSFKLQSANISESKSSNTETPSLSNSVNCDKAGAKIKEKVTDPFHIIDKNKAGGIVTLNGKVVVKTREYFGNEEIEKIFLQISKQKGDNPAGKFYSHFSQMVERGNTINSLKNDTLLFALGELKNSEFFSNADISPLAKKKIKDSLESGEEISLKMQIPIWLGTGAPSDFSFACTIKSPEN